MRTGRGLLVTQVRGLLREKMAGRGDRWSRDEKGSDVFRRVLFLHFPGSLKTRIDSSGCLTHETPGSWLTGGIFFLKAYLFIFVSAAGYRFFLMKNYGMLRNVI